MQKGIYKRIILQYYQQKWISRSIKLQRLIIKIVTGL